MSATLQQLASKKAQLEQELSNLEKQACPEETQAQILACTMSPMTNVRLDNAAAIRERRSLSGSRALCTWQCYQGRHCTAAEQLVSDTSA